MEGVSKEKSRNAYRLDFCTVVEVESWYLALYRTVADVLGWIGAATIDYSSVRNVGPWDSHDTEVAWEWQGFEIR